MKKLLAVLLFSLTLGLAIRAQTPTPTPDPLATEKQS